MSYTAPEAIKYFVGMSNDHQSEQKNAPKSKFSRIATNQMTLVSLRQVMNFSAKHTGLKEQALLERKLRLRGREKQSPEVSEISGPNRYEQLRQDRSKLDIPLTVEDFKYGATIVHDCTRVDDIVSQMKKDKIANVKATQAEIAQKRLEYLERKREEQKKEQLAINALRRRNQNAKTVAKR